MALLRSRHASGSYGSSVARWIAVVLVVAAIVAWAGLQDRVLQSRPARVSGPMRGASELVRGMGMRWAGPDLREDLMANAEGMATIDDAGEVATQPAHKPAVSAEGDEADAEPAGEAAQPGEGMLDKDEEHPLPAQTADTAAAAAEEKEGEDAAAEKPEEGGAAVESTKEQAEPSTAAAAAAAAAAAEPAKEEAAAGELPAAAAESTKEAAAGELPAAAAEPAKEAAAAAVAQPAKQEAAVAEPATKQADAEAGKAAQEAASKQEGTAAVEAAAAQQEPSRLTAKDDPVMAMPKLANITASKGAVADAAEQAKQPAQTVAQQSAQPAAKEEATAKEAATTTATTSAAPSAAAAAATASTAAAAGAASKGASGQLCTNSCPTASNGVCEDGRPKKGAPPKEKDPQVYPTTCDLGTDCDDCGPWGLSASEDKEALSWRPVAEILAKNYSINVRQTATPQPYWFAYTDPKQDVDVSSQMDNNAVFETGISGLWNHILKEGCIGPNGKRRLILDIGANFGYYTLMAASMGCRVIAWEPVPYFAAFLKYGILRNNFTDRVQVRETVVGDEHGAELNVVVPNRGIWGTAGVNGMNIDRAIENKGDYDQVKRTAERLDEVVKEDVLLMKVDVEGFEPAVLRSAAGLLLNYKVDNIIMEYSPGVAEREHDWDMYESHPAALARLVNANYTLLHLEAPQTGILWDGPLPKMEVVTKEVLKNDLEDAYRLQAGTLGCPMPEELKAEQGLWSCQSLPEGLHPQSFRATFGHNTNLWAVRGGSPSAALAKPGAPAALFPLDYDLKKFFSPNGLGAARRPCSALTPEVQVRHRCPCKDKAVCGQLEELVTRVAAQGSVPPQGSPPPKEADVDSLLLQDLLKSAAAAAAAADAATSTVERQRK